MSHTNFNVREAGGARGRTKLHEDVVEQGEISSDIEHEGFETVGSRRQDLEEVLECFPPALSDLSFCRWTQQALAKAFYHWDYEVEKSVLLRAQEQALQEEKRKELSERDDRISEISRELVEAREALDAQSSAALDEALEEQEQHRRAAQEHMERQHELERQLRAKISELKLQGGGAVVKVTVYRAENLPKVDKLGWIDAYCVLTLGEETHKTRILKRQQSPAWNETFALGLPDSESVLAVTLFDWELRRSDRAVGRLSISLRDIVETLSEVKRYELLGLDERPLLGEDGCPAVIELGISYEAGKSEEVEELKQKISEEAKHVEDEMGMSKRLSDVAEGRAQQSLSAPYWIKVHVDKLLHLPKTDTFGKCDPYCVLMCGKSRQETNICLSTYDAVFDEAFEFYVESASQSLVIEIFDSNKFSKDELIARLRVPVGKLSAGGGNYDLTMTGQGKSELLKGHDGSATSLSLRVFPHPDRLLTPAEPPPAQPKDLLGAAASGGTAAESPSEPQERRLLRFTLKAAQNLPKMDLLEADRSWTGKCDAFVKLCLGEQRKESSICKLTYDPTWNETFEFQVRSDSEELVLTVWDWDRIGQDEFVGSLHLPVAEMTSSLLQDQCIPLQREHKPCIGHNGSVTVLEFVCDMIPIHESFPLKISSEDDEGTREQDASARRRGRLIVTLVNAENLPRNDSFMRSTDPYVILSVDGQTYQSRTKHKSCAPTWNEPFEFSCTTGESILSLAVRQRSPPACA
eukprot:768772-Hanusia_phi.AAC.7